MPRYKNTKIIDNDLEFYEFLREKRQVRTSIVHYSTPAFINPSSLQRMGLTTVKYIWTYGDRYYKLADKHYGDVNYWWVIALYNGYPTEATIKPGDMIHIPLDLEEVLTVMEAYQHVG